MAKTAHTFDEENIKYLRGILGDEKVDTFLAIGSEPRRGTSEEQESCKMVKECLDQMEMFGDNRWWTSSDKRILGYYQLISPILLIPFKEFKESLQFLVGHSVSTLDMVLNYESLVSEAKRAFNGTQDSE